MDLISKTKTNTTEIKRLFYRAISLSIILIQETKSVRATTTDNMIASRHNITFYTVFLLSFLSLPISLLLSMFNSRDNILV